MDYEPRSIEIMLYTKGGPRISKRGFPDEALIDPDFPNAEPGSWHYGFAQFMDAATKQIIRITVGPDRAIYQVTGFTTTGLFTCIMVGWKHHGGDIFHRPYLRRDVREQVDAWLMEPR